MSRLALLAIVLSLIAVLAPTASAQKQPGNLTLSGPDSVKFGRALTLTGKLTGPNNDNRPVTLREDLFQFDLFADVATTPTNAQGEYAFSRTPVVNARYQTRQSSEESRIVTVSVTPAISLRLSDRTPRAGRRVRFSGRVCPEHDGAALKVQRRTAPKQWRTVAGTTLADLPGSTCSSYSRRIRVRRDGTYRTWLAAHADHGAGSSRAKRVDVH